MLFGLRARHGSVRNVDGEGDEKSFDSASGAKFIKLNFDGRLVHVPISTMTCLLM